MTILVKVSETGEIAIPKDVRDAHDWGAGTELEVIDEGGSVILRPVAPDLSDEAKQKAIETFMAGRIRHDGPPVTLDMMNAAVSEEVARRWHEKGH